MHTTFEECVLCNTMRGACASCKWAHLYGNWYNMVESVRNAWRFVRLAMRGAR